MKQIVVFTALPQGVSADGTRLRLSVLVSPRLETAPALSGTLADFPDFQDWPGQDVDFAVEFGGGPAVPATRTSPGPDAALWASLFPATMPVTGFVPDDYTAQTIHSFPVVNIVSFLKEQYGRVGASSPANLPTIQSLLDRGFEDIATLGRDGQEVFDQEQRLEAELRARLTAAGGKALPPAPPEPGLDFFRAAHFHRFRGGKRETPMIPPEFDFHQALSLLSDHPILLRRLGLVIELEVALDGQAAAGTVRVVPERQVNPGDEDRTPLTAYELDPPSQVFLPAPKPGSSLVKGMLNLAAPGFSLEQVDADGGALKAVDFANQMVMIASGRRKTADSPTEAGLPALRTGGVLLAHTGRAVAQFGKFAGLKQLANDVVQATPTLFADDLVTGYRVDVERDGSGVWRSLCERDVTYEFERPGSPPAETARDEGVVTTAMTHDTTSPTPTEFFLHEAVFHWDGWSLAAPRVGEAIQKNGVDHAEKVDNPSGSPLELSVTAKVAPGTLPRLRIGGEYRLRARVVDPAGKSRPIATTDAASASPSLVYRRFEPVEAPPVMWLTAEKTEDLPGESTARVVIRSANSDETLDGVVSPELSERLIAPPKTSVTMIEQLGKLDTPGGVDGSATTWARLAAKDPGTLPDRGDTPPSPFPYIPDPLAVAAALRGLPGTVAGSEHLTSFEPAPDWLEPSPYRLAVIEGDGPPQWDPNTRTLTVLLPKAGVAKVRLSSVIRPEDLGLMAVWPWIVDEAFDADALAQLRALAEKGGHWMITPFRELTLVHAVLQPLASPAIQGVSPSRTLGATYATLAGTVDVHAASTGKIDLLAAWSEPTGVGFARRDGNAHAFEVPVHDPAAASVALGARRHEFGDTKYRRVRYTAGATTRFREYFLPTLTDVPGNLQRLSPAALEVDILSSARPLAPTVAYVIPTFGWEAAKDATAVSSRRRAGLRVYLEGAWFSSGDDELLGVTVWLGPSDKCGAGAEPPLQNAPDPNAVPQLPDELKLYATQWGRDPIWRAGNPHPLPTLEHFPRATAVETGLSIEERGGVGLGVAGHTVGYDEDRQLFYCDLDVDAGDTYYPFVRLALARYQPHSVKHAELSRIVLAEFIQLAPDRMVWIARDPVDARRLAVTVSGTGYRGNASFPCASQIEVRLERFLSASEGDIGWVPATANPSSLLDTQAIAGQTVWTGTVELPPDRDDARFRLVVQEYEYFLGDVPELLGNPLGLGRDRRLVYADAVEVSPV